MLFSMFSNFVFIKKDKLDNWSIDLVKEWLQNIGLSQYQEIFYKNEIDGKTLKDFTIFSLDISFHFTIILLTE